LSVDKDLDIIPSLPLDHKHFEV